MIDAQFTGHPSRLNVPDDILNAVSKYKVPYSAAIAEIDFQVDEKLGLEVEAGLRDKVGAAEDHDWQIKFYKGASHGFCVRARPHVQKEVEAFHAAARQAIDWFNKYLK